VLLQVPAGSGGDTWGRRPFFGAAMVLLLVAQLARWQARDAAVLLVAQLLAGAALGTAGVNAWALIADAGGRARRGLAFGILNASLSVGLVAGYLVAGGLGSLAGWRTESLVLAALPLITLPAVAWVPGRPLASSRSGRPGLGMVLRALWHRRRLTLAAVAALTLSAGQGVSYLLPFGAQQRDLGPLTAALLLVPYVVGSVVAAPLGGRIGDRFGPSPIILAALLAGTLACVALIWGAGSSLVLVACFAVIGGAVNGALPLVAVRVVTMGDPSGVGMGTLMAGLRMGQSLGSFLGPLIAGAVLALVGLDAAWLAQAACLLLALALHALA
jgi:predicted MFS family arabinose efflux permease